ncbi:MAG: hypothetical protein HZA93_26750 [Verrucomicrobia bacterium]|nr:hypothetical protein [Verrucomicrobiota bacterium]
MSAGANGADRNAATIRFIRPLRSAGDMEAMPECCGAKRWSGLTSRRWIAGSTRVSGFQLAIRLRLIRREVGACLQAIQLVAHRLQAGSYKSGTSHLESELE